MIKRMILLILLIGVTAPLTGCITYPPEPRGHEIWVNGHYSRYGQWIAGHWI